MDNIRSILSITLSKIPASEILNGNVFYNHITLQNFVQLSSYYVKNYSNDELENLYSYISNEYEAESEYIRGFMQENQIEGFSVFDVILLFAVKMLIELDGEPVCRYENLLRWRMTSHELDEDVFTTAYMAYRDRNDFNRERTFTWRPIIRHNNLYLNKIISQGMAENHFHLKGSAPQFPLSWLSMMNNVANNKFRKEIEIYGKKRLSTIYNWGTETDSFYVSYLKAALIRVFLYYKVVGMDFFYHERQEEKVENLFDYIKNEQEFMELLRSKEKILSQQEMIQEKIDRVKENQYGRVVLDYALNGDLIYLEKNVNSILSGERWLMYKMFSFIYEKNQEYEKYYNLFYAYLVIKDMMRSELVQTNTNLGFDNFERFQDRKESFIEGTGFEKCYIEMAIKGTITNQNIKYLEARITPKKNALENKKIIEKYEKIIGNDSDIKKMFFYVFHFIKEKDDLDTCESDLFCRHHGKRESLRKQAQEVVKFRERYPKEAERVKGIDACSKEIYCRPEVFSQTYRYLRNHIVYSREENWDENQMSIQSKVKQLSMTYHVGEDYLDLIDGLRSIDEAICFLQLNCGSRLGHALALGTDVEEYYKLKNYRILINQQDYLDNLVWIYYTLRRFGIHGYDDIIVLIEKEYHKYFREIYGKYINEDCFKEVLREADEYYKGRNRLLNPEGDNAYVRFDISDYYAAYQLRGDNPKCYEKGYFCELDDISEWNRYSVHRGYPRDYKLRYRPACAYLYYMYHYSSKVKKEGRKSIEKKIGYRMIECIRDVQKAMVSWVATLGIGIECNPSSNYFIGIYDQYVKHPIFKFYNMGLTTSQEELEECPQLPVCINTDDQGIFSTYLDNEYALLALALEKAKDENGHNKYKRSMIYEWINNIREQSIRLSFMEQPYGIEK